MNVQPIFILESLQHLAPNTLALLVTAVAMRFFWNLRKDPRGGLALWIAAMAAAWNLGAILMRASAQAWLGIAGYEITTVSGLFASALMLPLALRQADPSKRLPLWWTRAVLAAPALILALKWSTSLFTAGYTFELGPPVSFAWPVHGRFAGFEHTLGYGGALVGATIVAQTWSAASSRLRRMQSAALVALVLLPMLGSIIQTSQHGSGFTRTVSIAALAMSASILAYLALLSRESHFALMPVARDLVVDSMEDGLLVADASGKAVDLNPAAQRMLHHPPLGCEVGPLLVSQGFVIPEPGDIATRSDEDTCIELRVSEVIERGTLIGHAYLLRDVTTAVRAQDELHRAKALAEQAAVAKSEFLATMSHEIRTPLNGVIGMARLILDEPLEAAVRRKMETLDSSAQSLRSILDDILDISRIDSGRMRIDEALVSLDDLAQDVTALFREQAAAKGVELRFSRGDAVPRAVWGDSLRIRQVLANLVGNAVKFTSQGYVLVELDAELNDGETSAWVTLRVRDTGIGIPADRIGSLFERFVQVDASTTRKFGGAGLGLSICRKLAELMGGRISVKSQLEAGSEFTVELPMRLAPASAEPPLVRRAALTPVGSRVLLAEDNPVNQYVATEMLRKLGCAVDLASNGREALEKAANNQYDSILMDCHMPELDGYATAAAMRQSGLATPIIALTASVLPGDRERCLASGMNDFVPKPIDLAELHQALLRNKPQKP